MAYAEDVWKRKNACSEEVGRAQKFTFVFDRQTKRPSDFAVLFLVKIARDVMKSHQFFKFFEKNLKNLAKSLDNALGGGGGKILVRYYT